MARYDFGLTTEEFGRTTPGMFMALMKRRAAEFKHDCYQTGTIASMLWNVNRKTKDDKVMSPFDFVPDEKRDEKREELKRNIHSLFAMLGVNPHTNVKKLRRDTISKLTKAGHKDVEQIFDEVFSKWQLQSEP